MSEEKRAVTAAVGTVSDRSSRQERPDASGPRVAEFLRSRGYDVVETALIPDERTEIVKTLKRLADDRKLSLVLTTGGTGFAPRDVTPEATEEACDRLTPGIPEAMRAASLKVTPHAMLSRGTAGIRGSTLVVNLPGSPKGAVENLAAVAEALPHALEILRRGAEPE